MKQSVRFTLMTVLLIGAYVLSACGGTIPQSATDNVAPKVLAKEIVFTGIIEAMNGNQWVVSGQTVTVDSAAAMDPNITVGVIVKVEGNVSADGTVVALKIETSTVTADNANDGNSNDVGNSNDHTTNGNANSNDDNGNDDNGNDDNSNDAGDDADEVFGVVEALTANSVTIGGVTYQFASFTEFKDAIAVGDQVKIHVIVNADGTFAIREIEKSDDLGDDNSNDDNGNDDDSNSNDDNGNDDDSNSNDDNGNDDDSNSNDDNGNDENSNDDDDDDDNGNDNSDD